MPRTKISKNAAKRNRQATNDEMVERLKQLDSKCDEALAALELKFQHHMKFITNEFLNLRQSLPETILQMRFGDLLDLKTISINEYPQLTGNSSDASKLITTINSTVAAASINRKISKDDEGYITEDGVIKSTATAPMKSKTPMIHISRPLGPLSSAKAKGRHRRSRSALGVIENQHQSLKSSAKLTKMKTTSQLRTMSADRAAPVTPKIAPNAPLSVLRYPRLGETVISLSGSPVVAQGLNDPTANVNIPVKNGIISLRPTKMNGIDPEIITQIDQETLHQIKQLQSNLNIIMNFASKEGL